MHSHETRRPFFAGIAIPVAFGVVVATGTLTIGMAVYAAVAGYTLGDLYTMTFPTYRGGSAAHQIPGAVYAIFVAYVIAAAQIAILCRRRIVARSARRG
jgi:hypothetical protein